MPADPRDYKLDLSASSSDTRPAGPSAPRQSRPYLSVHFACCGVYQRIYRSPDQTCYRGRCPRCGVTVNFPIGQGGIDARCFVVH